MERWAYEDVLAFVQSWGAVYFMIDVRGGVRLRPLAVQSGGLQGGRAHSARRRRGCLMSNDKKEIDDVSGTETTGHEWDGIKELNTPLPRWWLWHVLCLHRLGDRLLDRYAGLADIRRLHARPPQSFRSATRCRWPCRALKSARAGKETELAPCEPAGDPEESRPAAVRAGGRQSRVRRQLRAVPRRRRPGQRTAIPTSTTTCGSGAASSTTSSTRSRSACARRVPTPVSRRCRPSGATGY